MRLPKPSKTRKQGREACYPCPICGEGSVNKTPLELNLDSGLFHCLRCGYKGKLEGLDHRRKKWEPVEEKQREQGETVPVPEHLYRKLYERKMDPPVLIGRYGVLWDGSRFCFPVLDGYWRRAAYPAKRKVLMDRNALPREGGVLGAHLLTKGCVAVVTEGDYKAASIPLPWIGIGLGGTHVTPAQVDTIMVARPKMVLVMLDGGVHWKLIDRVVDAFASKMMEVEPILTLPKGKGPDDIPMWQRVQLLLEVVT